MRSLFTLAALSLAPMMLPAQLQQPAPTPAVSASSAHRQVVHFKLEFVLRPATKPFDLSAFESAGRQPGLDPTADVRRGDHVTAALHPGAGNPNVVVCYGRGCETRRP